jgi:hypothetical protein
MTVSMQYVSNLSLSLVLTNPYDYDLTLTHAPLPTHPVSQSVSQSLEH